MWKVGFYKGLGTRTKGGSRDPLGWMPKARHEVLVPMDYDEVPCCVWETHGNTIYIYTFHGIFSCKLLGLRRIVVSELCS